MSAKKLNLDEIRTYNEPWGTESSTDFFEITHLEDGDDPDSPELSTILVRKCHWNDSQCTMSDFGTLLMAAE